MKKINTEKKLNIINYLLKIMAFAVSFRFYNDKSDVPVEMFFFYGFNFIIFSSIFFDILAIYVFSKDKLGVLKTSLASSFLILFVIITSDYFFSFYFNNISFGFVFFIYLIPYIVYIYRRVYLN